mgnify:CR=1 FL=1
MHIFPPMRSKTIISIFLMKFNMDQKLQSFSICICLSVFNGILNHFRSLWSCIGMFGQYCSFVSWPTRAFNDLTRFHQDYTTSYLIWPNIFENCDSFALVQDVFCHQFLILNLNRWTEAKVLNLCKAARGAETRPTSTSGWSGWWPALISACILSFIWIVLMRFLSGIPCFAAIFSRCFLFSNFYKAHLWRLRLFRSLPQLCLYFLTYVWNIFLSKLLWIQVYFSRKKVCKPYFQCGDYIISNRRYCLTLKKSNCLVT